MGAAKFDLARLNIARDVARRWTESGDCAAVAVAVGTSDAVQAVWHCGTLGDGSRTPLGPQSLFTVASLTKPVVAMGVLRLVEQGRLHLNEKVNQFLPEFAGKGRYAVRVRHLLTHTAGLPDHLPHDRDLRRENAPLSRFLADACATELLFPPGRGVSYSSLGFLLLGEIVARVTRLSLPVFLRAELFAPLGMSNTALGVPRDWQLASQNATQSPANRFAAVQLPADQQGGGDWNWNSVYWRSLGAPWGGLISTAEDLGAFAQAILADGRTATGPVFAPATVAAALADATATYPDLPETDRRCRSWGLGWRRQWPAHDASFGDLVSRETCGHFGATGTLLWIDPVCDCFAVILTTLPLTAGNPGLIRLSNAIAAARMGGAIAAEC